MKSNFLLEIVINLYLFNIGIPYIGRSSKKVTTRLSKLLSKKFNIETTFYFKSFKAGTYFRLKNKTPYALLSNVVYKFKCSHDARETYIGMSTRHLITRANEHLNVRQKSDSAINQHIRNCEHCSAENLNVYSFKILKKCPTEYETKIQEALLIN